MQYDPIKRSLGKVFKPDSAFYASCFISCSTYCCFGRGTFAKNLRKRTRSTPEVKMLSWMQDRVSGNTLTAWPAGFLRQTLKR